MFNFQNQMAKLQEGGITIWLTKGGFLRQLTLIGLGSRGHATQKLVNTPVPIIITLFSSMMLF